MQLIKGEAPMKSTRTRKSDGDLASGFHEATIRDTADYLSRVRYIHVNPVAAGLSIGRGMAVGSAGGQFTLDPIPQG